MQEEMEALNLANKESAEATKSWEQRYNEEAQRHQEEVQRSASVAHQAVVDWKASEEFTKEVTEAMSRYAEPMYLRSWNEVITHVMEAYPDLDRLRLMEPMEKARYDRRLRKAEDQGISIEELEADDDALEYMPPSIEAAPEEEDENDEDDGDAGDDDSDDGAGPSTIV